jgi:hypothetical protein
VRDLIARERQDARTDQHAGHIARCSEPPIHLTNRRSTLSFQLYTRRARAELCAIPARSDARHARYRTLQIGPAPRLLSFANGQWWVLQWAIVEYLRDQMPCLPAGIHLDVGCALTTAEAAAIADALRRDPYDVAEAILLRFPDGGMVDQNLTAEQLVTGYLEPLAAFMARAAEEDGAEIT